MESLQKSDLISNFRLITTEDQNLTEDEKKKFENIFNKTVDKSTSPLDWDKWIYRIIVLSLGLAVIGCVLFGFLLALWKGGETPQILIAMGSASVGALAGLLAPSPKSK